MSVSTEAVIRLGVGDTDDCICCPGNHIYVIRDELTDGSVRPGAHGDIRRHVDDWLNDYLYGLRREHNYALDGRRIRVTVELLPE